MSTQLSEPLTNAVSFESAALVLSLLIGIGFAAKMIISALRGSTTSEAVRNQSRRIERKIECEVSKANGGPLAILSNMPTPAWVKGIDGRVRFINEAYTAEFHLTKAEYEGRYDHEIWPLDVAMQFAEHDRIVMKEGNRIETVESVPESARNPQGPRKKWVVIKFPVRDAATKETKGVGGVAYPMESALRALHNPAPKILPHVSPSEKIERDGKDK